MKRLVIAKALIASSATASNMSHAEARTLRHTWNKACCVEPEGQHFLTIFTAFSLIYVEQPHNIGSALYKQPTNCCKNKLERSTDPSDYTCFVCRS